MSEGRRAPGALEAEVMAALWAAERALTPAEVQAALGSTLAYNTVLTILGRLHDKGRLVRRPAGRGHVYWPAKDEAAFAAETMRATLTGRPDRERVLQQFAATLDDADAAALRAFLEADRP
ncbi:BlaI/MecI/CopY family transcriptional regulator [Catenuloplanes atrovinosus]|uniref:Transcriptional regulator n=1 Tax=Catenuloplanes atrovinosus TaxID=137266 RepID=A0AAE3YK66_9ACTN|nr:BlaI/MecI/CopY family transcriptional regulator [Catenuloplanes atrovinosus]MDR7274417.1 putative transcriptional regulator [Catenuloplanes atrovinosus]